VRELAAVFRRELAERWLLALAAALLGLIPLAVPFLPLGFSRAPDARSGTAIALAVIVSYVLALVLGSTVLARDLAERRLGFYFARPLPGWAIWAGKLAGAALLAFGSGVLVLLPAMLLGDRPDPSGYWSWGIGQGFGSALGFALWAMTVLALLLAANAFSTMVRSRSPWLLLDLLAGTLLVGLFVVTTGRLLSAWALGALGMAQAGLLLAGVLSFAAASAVQVTRARTDPRRGHRLLSLTLWALLGLSALAYGGYAWWVLAATPEDLVEIEGVIPAPAGDWIAVGGTTGKLRGGLEPVFLMDTSSGRSFRLQASPAIWGGLAFSRDGRHAVWLQMAGRGTFPVTVHRLELGRPGAEPVATPIGFSEHVPHSLVLSPDGGRMACLVDDRIVAQEMGNGRLLLSTPVLPGEFWSPDRLRFLDSGTLRFYGTRMGTRMGTRLQEGRSELRVVDFDLGTGRAVRELRVPRYDHALRAVSPDGQRVLLRSRTLTRDDLAVVDLRTGEPPAGILNVEVLSDHSFLPDGRVVIARRSSPARGGRGRIELRLLDDRGAELKRFDLPGHRARLGGLPAPGLLVVATTRNPSEKTWRSVLLDLESGALRPIGEGLFPHGWPGLPIGSIGTKLFVQENGGLVQIDPVAGHQRAILHP
jgi:hypothetical protein